ncbi:MAG: 2-iminoacetate synthase ThiH [Verrucomicrobia bacterium]|jgi:2-iminoacetate synthase|nr:2-iminoacetate synthase ThiH [Verrucomicrobiota bacterium]MBT7065913.1 2-iminoacetate synthase ThiH [Verrucomicrobiota bacterium]MBT7700838.1 2-iminoacetate synthase ThiH [Verrucomicrobiota bacterium]
MSSRPAWLDPRPYAALAGSAGTREVTAALTAAQPTITDFAALLSPAAASHLEAMAQRARELTRGHFGNTIQLYAPLYLSNYCTGGCSYCGFSSDRHQPRHKLTVEQLATEMKALRAMHIEEILLLTGERTPEADFDYLNRCVADAAAVFPKVTVEAFGMRVEEYSALEASGCTGITLYQETYDPTVYEQCHRWGEKRDFAFRIAAPDRAFESGLRSVGIGALLGLADPVSECLALYQHVRHLQRRHWKGGITVSFPRLRPEAGGFRSPHPVDEPFLARIIFAFRICFADVPLVLSTRESAGFRDGMAGIGINKMSVASRTTVGGYEAGEAADKGQFEIDDNRDVTTFCSMLRAHHLEPVFKNWDAVFR